MRLRGRTLLMPTIESLLKSADTAMYKAKISGRKQHCFYDAAFAEEN